MVFPSGIGDFFRQNSGSDYFHRIVKKMTGYKVPCFDLFQFRCFTLTFFSCKFAAACKAAARSAVDGASHLALQRKDLFASFLLRIRDRDRRQKSLGIGMLRIAVKLVTGSQLYDMSHVHNTDTVGNMFYHRKIVSDKEIGQTQLFLKLDQQIDNLRLNRNIQCGDRLITDNKFRIYCSILFSISPSSILNPLNFI